MLPQPNGDLWVFAYASLIWNPDFEYVESSIGRLNGFHRALCIRSIHYRGTRENPGLVMGLDRGGFCEGVAYRVCKTKETDALKYLFEREMLNNVYVPTILPVTLKKRTVDALTFVSNTSSDDYVPNLNDTDIINIVKKAHGSRGSNFDYVNNTIAKLEEMHINDPLSTLWPKLQKAHTT